MVELALKCIETSDDRDAYARIARALARLARGRLPLEDVTSEVDLERRTAQLAFRIEREVHRLTPRWMGAWLDPDVLAQLSAVLRARAPRWSFYAFEGSGEGQVIVCVDRDGYLRLRAAGAPITRL